MAADNQLPFYCIDEDRTCTAPTLCRLTFGYCKLRNLDGAPLTNFDIGRRRRESDAQFAAQSVMAHPNGKPKFSPDGTMLDDNGNRSIFDDVDR